MREVFGHGEASARKKILGAGKDAGKDKEEIPSHAAWEGLCIYIGLYWYLRSPLTQNVTLSNRGPLLSILYKTKNRKKTLCLEKSSGDFSELSLGICPLNVSLQR